MSAVVSNCDNGYITRTLSNDHELYIASISLFSIHTFLLLLHICLSSYYTTRLTWLQKRSKSLILLLHVSGWIQNFGLSGNVPRFLYYPCSIQLIVGMMIPAACLTPLNLLLADFYNRYIFAQLVFSKDDALNQTTNSMDESQISWRRSIADAWHIQWEFWIKNKKATSLPIERALRAFNLITSRRFRIWFSIFSLIPSLTLVLIFVFVIDGKPLRTEDECEVCEYSLLEFIFTLGSAYIGLVTLILVGWKLRKYADPFGILTEIRQLCMYGGLLASTAYLAWYIFTDSAYMQYKFSNGLFISVGFMLMISTSLYQIRLGKKFQSSESESHRQKKNNNKTTTTTITTTANALSTNPASYVSEFESFLLDPHGLEAFQQYLIQEFSSELLAAHQEILYFETTFANSTESTRMVRFKRIMKRFFEPNAVLEVNIHGEIRSELLKMSSNKSVDIATFDKAKHDIEAMLYGCYLRMKTKENHRIVPIVGAQEV